MGSHPKLLATNRRFNPFGQLFSESPETLIVQGYLHNGARSIVGWIGFSATSLILLFCWMLWNPANMRELNLILELNKVQIYFCGVSAGYPAALWIRIGDKCVVAFCFQYTKMIMWSSFAHPFPDLIYFCDIQP